MRGIVEKCGDDPGRLFYCIPLCCGRSRKLIGCGKRGGGSNAGRGQEMICFMGNPHSTGRTKIIYNKIQYTGGCFPAGVGGFFGG